MSLSTHPGRPADGTALATLQAELAAIGTEATIGNVTPRVAPAVHYDPISAWNQAVAEKVARGMPKARAISAVANADPALHVAYVNAYNELHGRRADFGGAPVAQAPAPVRAAPVRGVAPAQIVGGDATAQWNQAIEAKVAAGMNRARATSAVVREQPDLHLAMLRATNAAAGRRVNF